MPLVKIADLYPNYKEDIFDGKDIKNFSVYDHNADKIGSVHDILVDESDRFRYLVIDTGFWIFGKKVLLPIGKASVDYTNEKIYAKGLSKEQAEHLPEYDDDMTVDRDYEERVRATYRGTDYEPDSAAYAQGASTSTDLNVSDYDSEPSLYGHQETDEHQNLKLYEERLVANKERFRTGSVSVGKRVETETASVSVPVEKERVIVERSTPTDTRAVASTEATFGEGEVARIEVYEESATIEKQAFVREEVSVRKEVDRDIVSANETIRREEIDIDTEGDAVINRDL